MWQSKSKKGNYEILVIVCDDYSGRGNGVWHSNVFGLLPIAGESVRRHRGMRPGAVRHRGMLVLLLLSRRNPAPRAKVVLASARR